MCDTNELLLREAILRNTAAILSLPSAGMLRHHKTRFLAECPDGVGPGSNGLWIEAPTDDSVLVDDVMARVMPVGIAFKSGQTSVVFEVPIHRRLAEFRLNQTSDQNTVAALLLPFPQSYKSLQRRSVYRVAVPLESLVRVRIWRLAEHAVLRDRPMAAAEVQTKVRDLSVMGMGVTCTPKDGKPPRLTPGQRLRVQLKFGETEVLVESRLVHQRMLGENILAVGMSFKKLEKDLEGRQALSKLTAIVGHLQREELTRRRSDTAPGAASEASPQNGNPSPR